MTLLDGAASAVDRLSQSKLTNQLEGLGATIDVHSLDLFVDGKLGAHLRESITDARLTRTVEGASTLSVTVLDRDNVLLKSGIFGQSLTLSKHEKTLLGSGVAFEHPWDVHLDGLWFRGVALNRTEDRDVTLTFEDREVALLRQYPKKLNPDGKPNHYYDHVRWWPSTRDGQPVMDRAMFMVALIKEVREVPIRIRCPLLDDSSSKAITERLDAVTKAVQHRPGFSAAATITVKHHPATPDQRLSIERVLDVGERMKAPRNVLVAAVMVVTQESSALTSATNGVHVGLFQQDSRPGSVWVGLGGATRVPENDAAAFFTVVMPKYLADPSQDLADLAESVQVSGLPLLYANWRAEAEDTVKAYRGDDGTTPILDSPYSVPPGGLPDIRGAFYRGTTSLSGDGRKTFLRENNWQCLQRYATAVGWRVYCVSGTIYIETDGHLYNQKIAMTFSEDTPGIHSIPFSVDAGKANATVTVNCQVDKWEAPPGSVVVVTDMGPVDGKWLVNTIDRGLFGLPATVTLKKKQPVVPDSESATPVQPSGKLIYAPDGSKAEAAPSVDQQPIRDAIVEAAKRAIALQATFRYVLGAGHGATPPTSLFAGTTDKPLDLDCSSFVTLCYKAGGAADPNNLDYSRLGTTVTLIAHATLVTVAPIAGDLVFYGSKSQSPEHVAILIGGTKIANMGALGEPKEENITDVALPIIGYGRYQLAAAGQPSVSTTIVGP